MLSKTSERPNSVVLIGNLGDKAKTIQTEKSEFTTLSLATHERYQDTDGNWHSTPAIWHNNILVFDDELRQIANSLKKGERIKILGTLSYQFTKVTFENGKTGKVDIARITARGLEKAPLTPANDNAEPGS
jgi:single-stranded DNA-binding protein